MDKSILGLIAYSLSIIIWTVLLILYFFTDEIKNMETNELIMLIAMSFFGMLKH